MAAHCPAPRGAWVRELGPSSSSISARLPAPWPPSPAPSPATRGLSSAGDAWLWEGLGPGPQGQCSILLPPLSASSSRTIHPPRSSGFDKYYKNFLAGGARWCPSFCRLFLGESTAVSPASPSQLVVRGGHLCAPTTGADCH